MSQIPRPMIEVKGAVSFPKEDRLAFPGSRLPAYPSPQFFACGPLLGDGTCPVLTEDALQQKHGNIKLDIFCAREALDNALIEDGLETEWPSPAQPVVKAKPPGGIRTIYPSSIPQRVPLSHRCLPVEAGFWTCESLTGRWRRMSHYVSPQPLLLHNFAYTTLPARFREPLWADTTTHPYTGSAS
ncbi:hypothetical protein CH63R_10780 [Colletotrichum higginsianum IMI 349063]|uniref:Uncharacterized protein n=1 Tax=Colletotrichum higginsianum (strain IMI 349063) TaxID=759273 RepID=A0A1B7Y3R0_COLHI|nr:uncharacterized protein CH63R_10780 [Colletotrichum higginsianum IMI 349063]OBR06660.1 hypothetical protein CH63R_10780 [Colletotrichum higginsianum IMI 349063]